MLSCAIEETSNILAAQSRLFINVGIAMETYSRGGNGLTPHDISCALSDAIGVRTAMYAQQDRCYAWRERVAEQKRWARNRLNGRLCSADQKTRPYDPNALGHLLRSMNGHITCRRPFAPLAEAVRATIKSRRAGDCAGQRAGKQRLIELAYNCTYSELVFEVMGKHAPGLRVAVDNARYRFDTGRWKEPVWADSSWIDRYPSHFVHASRETPGNVAFYPDAEKMEADKLTSMKPGRYLSAFYGDVFTAEEIKRWANKQMAFAAPLELKFVGNDDPLGWVWVYENSKPSCMRYNRNGRYIDTWLRDERHPVTVYANPENNLALAYIMMPGIVEDRTVNCGTDEHVVGARAIVNKARKTYLRIYADGDVQYSAMKEALERAGYVESGSTLHNEKLRLVETNSGYLCPYLDGDYVYVSVRSSHLLIGYDGLSAHATCGYVREDEDEDEDEDDNSRYCSHCDRYHDEDDGSYVESVGAWVCDGCISYAFVLAVGRCGDNELHRDSSDGIVYCEYDGNYYVTRYLRINGMGMTEDGEVYPDDQLAETDSGVYHTNDAVKLTYEFNDYQWAHCDRVYHLPNGETCHVDDADKIAEVEALEQEAA